MCLTESLLVDTCVVYVTLRHFQSPYKGGGVSGLCMYYNMCLHIHGRYQVGNISSHLSTEVKQNGAPLDLHCDHN